MSGLRDILDAATPGPWGTFNAPDRVLIDAKGFRVAEITADPDGPRVQQDAALIALAPELAALVLETDDLLRRLEEWDMLTLDAEGKGAATADAPFWRSEIQKARARLSRIGVADEDGSASRKPRLGAGDSNPRHGPGRGQNEKEQT